MLGGGFLQNFVIVKARQMGYYVYVLDADANAVGFKNASEHAVINIVDEGACLKFAREHEVDGVLTAATDYSVLTMSRIATEMKIPGINYESAKIIKNKAAVRRLLFDSHADDTGYSFELSSAEDVKDCIDKVKFPVMVKPCDGSGSRGASRVDVREKFAAACATAMENSITHRAVIEPFVVGKEYGVESFVNHGDIHVLAVMQKKMTQPPYYAELGHAVPSGLPEALENKVRNCVTKALKALGVNHGSVNMDLLIDAEGDVHIVDVGARMGGNLIGSHIVLYGTGIDYMGNMIRAAVGDPVDFNPVRKPMTVATRLLALTPGKVRELPDFEKIARENGVEIEHHLHVGDVINEYHTNLDGCGYVVVQNEDLTKAIETAEKVKNIIDNSICRI